MKLLEIKSEYYNSKTVKKNYIYIIRTIMKKIDSIKIYIKCILSSVN